MNRRDFLTLVPATAALTWTVTCHYEEEGHKKKKEEAQKGFHLEYFYATATYWDDDQMLQDAIVSNYSLSERRFHSIQNACDNIRDHNKEFFEKTKRMHVGFRVADPPYTIDYQVWYHGFDDKHSLVGELTLGENGIDTFLKQWVMNDRQFAATKADHDRRS